MMDEKKQFHVTEQKKHSHMTEQKRRFLLDLIPLSLQGRYRVVYSLVAQQYSTRPTSSSFWIRPDIYINNFQERRLPRFSGHHSNRWSWRNDFHNRCDRAGYPGAWLAFFSRNVSTKRNRILAEELSYVELLLLDHPGDHLPFYSLTAQRWKYSSFKCLSRRFRVVDSEQIKQSHLIDQMKRFHVIDHMKRFHVIDQKK